MKAKNAIQLTICISLIITQLLIAAIQPAHAAGRCYVNDDATGEKNGQRWEDAYVDLQSAISDVCTEIWVAAGTYKPFGSDRTASFNLQSGTAIYGGFNGSETLLSERDYVNNITILSGDLNGDDSGFTNKTENSYHVVTGIYVNVSSILDGFTIMRGNANGSSSNGLGGGMYLYSGSPTLTNITITNNYGTQGGGMYTVASSPTLTNVTISSNSAISGGGLLNGLYSSPTLTNITFSNNSATDGGGMFIFDNSSPILTNVTFSSNSATATGGGIYTLPSSPTLINVTFTNNSATNGGGIYFNGSTPTLKNVIIANSTSGGDCFLASGSTINSSSSNNLIESTGSSACNLTNGVNGNIIGSDPNLGSLTGSPAYFPLNAGSPAINAGTNTGCPNTSQNGVSRPQGSHCDIGSYEMKGYPTVSSIVRASTSPTSASNIDFTVTFSESVTGVDTDGSDFALNVTGVTGASITGVTPVSASVYTVSVNTGTGNGTIRLDVPDSATITDISNNDLFELPFKSGESYTIDKSGGSLPTSATFGDVPMNHPYWADIEILYANGFTGGCSALPLLFCPGSTMDRAQGAVFMLRGLVGTSYVPPVAPFANPFGDSWSSGPWAQRWAQGMLDEGLTAGCSASPLLYCPWEQMPRAQAAVFGMRLLNGSAYVPPDGTGTVFADINGSEWYAGWAEQAYLNNLLPVCGSSGGRPLFCPNDLVSRGLGAYMIVRARNLSMP